jgi:hypothetical protein
MPIRSRVRKLLAWGLLLVVASLAGGLGFAYSYITDSATLAALIRKEAPRYLRGSSLRVDRVLLRPLVGDVDLKEVSLWQRVDGVELQAVRIPWLHLRHDVRTLLRGRLEPSEVIVAQPTLRLMRRRDGSCNLQGLLASPWPGNPLSAEPAVRIRNGTVQLVDDRGQVEAILRDVAVDIEPAGAGVLRFEGTAKGDTFERLELRGTCDLKTGRVELSRGDLTRLTISAALLRRLPPELRRPLERDVRLSAGELDLSLSRLVRDPSAPAGRRLSYAATLALRSGTWDCPKLPFPLDDVSAAARVEDGILTLVRASGRSGKTIVRARGALSVEDPTRGPMDLAVEVEDLELDDRLRAKTPPRLAPLWAEYRPQGRVHLRGHFVRPRRGGEVVPDLVVECQDVAITYFLFPFPLEHIAGTLTWRDDRVVVDLGTNVGGAPLTARGTIRHPGPDGVADLTFAAGAMPIDAGRPDDPLMRALPADIRRDVAQFHPKGSARGTATLHRDPPARPGDDPIGRVRVVVSLDLNPGCEMLWDGLKYPVTNLTGHLDLQPNRWEFKGMKGSNGLAQIAASGWVRQDALGRREVALALRADHLPFDRFLRQALPREWQATWDTLNPSGTSRVDARIAVPPGGKPRYHLTIVPEADTHVHLKLTPVPGTVAPGVGAGGTIDLPVMEDVRGSFVFDDGVVTMSDVKFVFRESPVSFAGGTVTVWENGRFALGVWDLVVEKLRLDSDLRRIMPPRMAAVAGRLDNGRPFWIKAGGAGGPRPPEPDLGISWSGRAGEPAECTWRRGRVVLIDNAIQAGLPLEHLQGEVANIHGRSDGQTLEVYGALELASGDVLGQQVTGLSSPIAVSRGVAALPNLKGGLLGGELTGRVEVHLDATPRYWASLTLREADLERYTRTLPGRQHIRGKLSARLNLEGLSSDLRTVQGEGQAKIADGDLGKLPILLRLFKVLNLSATTPTAFDSVDVTFKVQNGEATLHPIKFTGDAISLLGSGTVNLQGDIDLRLRPLYGRDEGWLHVMVLSDLVRELGGQLFDIHATGPFSLPNFALEPVPAAAKRVARLVQGRGKDRRRASP